MTQTNLKIALRDMVLEHGFEQVYDELHKIQVAEPDLRRALRSSEDVKQKYGHAESRQKTQNHSTAIRCKNGVALWKRSRQ